MSRLAITTILLLTTTLAWSHECGPVDPLPPAETEWVAYNGDVNPNEMVYDGTRFAIDVEVDGTVWWNAQQGEALVNTGLIYPGDTVEFLRTFAEGATFPASWGYAFGFGLIMQDVCNWEFGAVGNRPSYQPVHVTIERKISVGCQSRQGDVGGIGAAVADVRAAVLADGTLEWDWRQGGAWQPLSLSWEPARINCSNGCQVMIGAYAYGTKGLPFTGGVGEVRILQ